jgi:hypothetical protein
MKMKLKQIAFYTLALALAGCQVDDDFDGPDLNDLYGAFSVVEERVKQLISQRDSPKM